MIVFDKCNFAPKSGKHRLRNMLLASTILALSSFAGGADVQAQTHTTVDTGQTVGQVMLTADGDQLTVAPGGTVSNGAGEAVFGVQAAGDTVTIINGGSIVSALGRAIFIADTSNTSSDVSGIARLDNLAGAAIAGFHGIQVQFGHIQNLTNAGDIIGAGAGGFAILTNGSGSNIINLSNLAGGRIIGADSAIILSDTSMLTGLTNSGIIGGLAGHGIHLTNGSIINLSNLSGGQIYGGLNGIFLDGVSTITGLTNSGEILGVTDNGIFVDGDLIDLTNNAGGYIHSTLGFGINVTGDMVNLANAGRISSSGTTDTAVYANYNIINLNNSGVIESVGDGENTAIWSPSGTITGLVNSGLIIGFNTTNIGNHGRGIIARHIASITNSGRIFSGMEGDFVGGLAIYEELGGDTDLVLLPGSAIQGRIEIQAPGFAADTDNLYVGKGLNLATTFQNALPDMIQTYGSLLATNGTQVAVVDTSLFDSAGANLSAMTGAISGVLGEQSGKQYQGRSWWLKGFGGINTTSATGVSVENRFAGAMIGVEGMLEGDLHLGLFAGGANSIHKVEVTNGTKEDSTSFFAGVYGALDMESYYLQFGVTAGRTDESNTRIVANNFVKGGLETANASYDSYFISPEITISTDTVPVGEQHMTPSARIRYGFMQSDGYTETGLTSGALSVGERTTQTLDVRLQLAMPIETTRDANSIEVRFGVDGRWGVGGNAFQTTLLGVNQTYTPGSNNSAISGFVGASLKHTISDVSYAFVSGEVGAGIDDLFHADIKAGLKMKF